MSKTVKPKNIYQPYKGEREGAHFGTRGSLRSSGRIRKRIILGEKFDYGEKTKEKQNYVLYESGQGQEKKEIEEMEQIYGVPKKHEKIVEEKVIIDNYQYHETKDIRKNKNKNCQTHHQRLCSPFERTKLVKYSSYTNEPIQNGYKVIKTTDLVNKKDYSIDNGLKKNYNQNNSNASKTYKYYGANKENSNPNVYETYVPPKRNIIYNYTDSNTYSVNTGKRSTSFGRNNESKNNNTKNNGVNRFKKAGNIQVNYKQSKEVYSPQNIVNYEFKENPAMHKNSSFGYRKTEYQKEDYTIKTSTYTRRNNNQNEISMVTNRIKYGSQSKPEKKIYEGPKYQFVGNDRPKSGNVSRRRPPLPRSRQIKKPKKGYIPFGGHGTRVGQGPLGQIPKPLPKSFRDNLFGQKQEGEYSHRLEKNTSYTKVIETTNRSIIKTMNDIKESGLTKKMKGNKSFSKISTYKMQKNNKNTSSQKFPGKGTRVGSSAEDMNKRLSSDSGRRTLCTEYTNKIELKTCDTDTNANEECSVESICYNGEHNGQYKEIICPVHGRKLIRISQYQKLMEHSTK